MRRSDLSRLKNARPASRQRARPRTLQGRELVGSTATGRHPRGAILGEDLMQPVRHLRVNRVPVPRDSQCETMTAASIPCRGTPPARSTRIVVGCARDHP